MTLEPIVRSIEVSCDQERAFITFAAGMPNWWPLDKRAMSLYSGGSAKSLRVEASVNGQIVEIGEDGAEHLWGTFTAYDPFDYIRMDFHMGTPPEQATVVDVRFFMIDAERTRVELTQSNWEAAGDMADMLYGGYASSWEMLFDEEYKKACES